MRTKNAIKEIKKKIDLYKDLQRADEKYWNNQIEGLKIALRILETPDDEETSIIDTLSENKKED